MFIHALISFFGFSTVAPKPKVPATGRVKPPSAAQLAAARRQREAERKAREDKEAIRAARAISTIGGAADVYARHVGQVGSKSSAAHFSRAKDVLGPRRRAYFEALVLAGRKVPMIPVPIIGNPSREEGFADGIDRDLNKDLDLWASIRAMEEKAADLARRTGKPIPTPINIPADIVQRLLERDRLRAGRAGGGGGGKRAPAAPVANVDSETPVSDVEPEKGGKGSRGKSKDDDDQETPPPAPGDAEKHDSDDDDEPPKGPGKP